MAANSHGSEKRMGTINLGLSLMSTGYRATSTSEVDGINIAGFDRQKRSLGRCWSGHRIMENVLLFGYCHFGLRLPLIRQTVVLETLLTSLLSFLPLLLAFSI